MGEDKPTVVQNFGVTGHAGSHINQVNQGTVNNPTANSYGNGGDDAIFEKLAALLSQTAAVNDIQIDQPELESITDEMQTAYDDTEATDETVAPVFERFKGFLSQYSERLLPLVAKSALGLLAAATTGHPLLAMLLTLMQDAVE